MEPCAVIASTCDNILPDQIIKGILNNETLPEPLEVTEGIRSYPWHINTKYYEADIHLCALDKKTIGTQEFAESVNALIICFDSFSDSKLNPVEQWISFTKEFETDIKILVCDHCHSETSGGFSSTVNTPAGISKFDAQQWCVKNGFELVELNPEETDLDSDVEDDFPESVGMERIIQALQAHLWPNLILKESHKSMLPPHAALHGIVNGLADDLSALDSSDSESQPNSKSTEKEVKIAKVVPMPKQSLDSTTVCSVTSSKIVPECTSKVPDHTCHKEATGSVPSKEIGIVPPLVQTEQGSSQVDVKDSTTPSASGDSKTNPAHRDERIDAMLEAFDSMSEDNFEQLFQNLSAMKSKAANLSPTDRKAYAEQMTIAFWKSIGGNESEIDLLSSDDDAA